MRNILCAGVAAVSICAAAPRPAQAWGGGFMFGTAVGLGVGAVIGTTIARPYVYGYAPYGYYPYGAYPSAYPYAVPYGYAYPPPVAYLPPGYPVPLSQGPASANYAPPAPTRTPATNTPRCAPGRFFNTLTGDCDRR